MLGVLLVVLSTVCLPVSSSDELVGRRFDAMLEIDGTALDPEEYLYRREIFTEKCKRMTEDPTNPCPKASANYMYTGVELDMMNGVKRAENVPDSYMVGGGDEQLYKRQDGVEVPTSYDVRDDVPVRVVGQGTCGNCYIQAVMGALEIAYYKQTGKEVHFSAQEFTECFYAGCSGGDPRIAMTYLADLDRLAQESDYGEYLVRSGGKEGTCKAATTPDSLLGMRVLGYKSITVDELPYYVYTHGAVVTCLAWSGEASGTRADCKVSEYEGGIYDDVEIKDGCDHAVLIIGYTPDYWIVKNSHGKSWGEDGYIRMKRGKNVCGMEQELNVLMTEVRRGEKEGIDPATRCPIERPNYCAETHTCTSKKTCKKPAPEKRSVHKGAIENNPLLQERDCADTSPVCSIVEGKDDVLCTSMGIALVCSKSCDTCDMEIVPPVRTNSPEQATGPCVRPSIANGKVSLVKLNAGDKFSVTCKPGYMRLGPETMECVIQEVYKPDTRLLPKCVPESRMSEKYVDNGATYSGMRNTSALGRECLNWMDSWNRGISGFAYFVHMALENRENWAREMNHNYCRNTGGKESVPFCIVEIMGNYKLEFCFEHPSCDKCKGAVDKYGDQSCMENAAWEKCPYGEYRKRNQADWYWNGCLDSCCAATGC